MEPQAAGAPRTCSHPTTSFARNFLDEAAIGQPAPRYTCALTQLVWASLQAKRAVARRPPRLRRWVPYHPTRVHQNEVGGQARLRASSLSKHSAAVALAAHDAAVPQCRRAKRPKELTPLPDTEPDLASRAQVPIGDMHWHFPASGGSQGIHHGVEGLRPRLWQFCLANTRACCGRRQSRTQHALHFTAV